MRQMVRGRKFIANMRGLQDAASWHGVLRYGTANVSVRLSTPCFAALSKWRDAARMGEYLSS